MIPASHQPRSSSHLGIDRVEGEIIGGDPARNTAEVWAKPDSTQPVHRMSHVIEGDSEADVRGQAEKWLSDFKYSIGSLAFVRAHPSGCELRIWGPPD